MCSQEWFAQHAAKSALKTGLQYSARDVQEEQRDNLNAYLIACGDRLSHPYASSNRDSDNSVTPYIEYHHDHVSQSHDDEQRKPLKITVGVVTDTHFPLVSF